MKITMTKAAGKRKYFTERDSPELAELLLAAVRGPHRSLTAKDFARLRQRARGNGNRSDLPIDSGRQFGRI
jgi:hypothetical protein